MPSAERRSSTGRWNTIACRRGPPAISGAFHAMLPAVGAQQSVAEPQQHALARAVGPEDHGARPRVESQRDAIDDAARPDREHDVVEAQRQQRERGTHFHADRQPYRRCAVSLTT